jgi:hypothetical protein
MSLNIYLLKLVATGLILCSALTLAAQSDIKVGKLKINHLDKQKRKQGEWIFFDTLGNIRMSCVYENDRCNSPVIFYENTDTAFIRFPIKDSIEVFCLYKNGKRYLGNFVHTSDSTSNIELDPDPAPTEEVIAAVRKYQEVVITPTYFFTQKKLNDFTSAAFTGSRFVFNKSLRILLTISSSGLVTNVEFPKDKDQLSGEEERELYRIYSTMPRWQPLFYQNKARATKVLLGNKSFITHFYYYE